MEEADPASTATTGTGVAGMDPTLQRKQASMLERLSHLHQTRLARKSNSISDDDGPLTNPSSFESIQSFLARFSAAKQSIESQLCLIQSQSQFPSNPSSKSHLQTVSLSISDLEKVVAENSYFLPPYEVRTCIKTISDLKQYLESIISEVAPRKKFAFKSKQAKKVSTTRAAATNEMKSTEFAQPELEKHCFKVLNLPGFRGKENEVLVKSFERESEGMGEFNVSDLSNCEVRLMGCLRALFVHRLKNCKVYVGPVLGSILIEEAEDCVFVLASHQIRTHHAKRCDFYLRLRSRPIIEDCSGVRFAPYCLCYDQIEKDLEEANLGEETGNWSNVDDFRWLRALQSPNWSVLPEHERIGSVHISNSEE